MNPTVKTAIKGISIILIIYTACFIFIQPYKYNFPLNDDWVYSYSVDKFRDTGTVRLSDWCAASIIFQVFAGILFSKIFGYSLSTLIISTFFISFTGSVFLYLILLKLNYKYSLLPVLCLIFNPVFFVLSFSFMTDVPYLAMFIISVYFYMIGIKGDNKALIVTGSVFAGAAYLIRQIGILVPLCAIAYLLLVEKRRINLKTIFSILLVPLVVFGFHWYWLNFIHGKNWVMQAGLVEKISFEGLYQKLAGSMFYFGLFLMPFGLTYLIKSSKKDADKVKEKMPNLLIQASVVLLAIILFVQLFIKNMPIFENTLNRTGLGTLTVSGSLIKSEGIFANDAFWLILTILCGISFILVYSSIFKKKFQNEEYFVLLCCLGQFLVSIMRFKFFDRYLLVLIPMGIVIGARLLNLSKISKRIVFGVILAVFIAFSLLGTKDYLSWNEAKWKLGSKLIKEHGYKAEEIANGFDWDGYFTFQKNIDKLKTMKPARAIGDWEWQSLNPYKVMLSYKAGSPEEGLVDEIGYFDWYSFKTRKIYAWKLQ